MFRFKLVAQGYGLPESTASTIVIELIGLGRMGISLVEPDQMISRCSDCYSYLVCTILREGSDESGVTRRPARKPTRRLIRRPMRRPSRRPMITLPFWGQTRRRTIGTIPSSARWVHSRHHRGYVCSYFTIA